MYRAEIFAYTYKLRHTIHMHKVWKCKHLRKKCNLFHASAYLQTKKLDIFFHICTDKIRLTILLIMYMPLPANPVHALQVFGSTAQVCSRIFASLNFLVTSLALAWYNMLLKLNV